MLPQNVTPLLSDVHPKMTYILQKWVILPQNVWCSPQNELFSPKMGDSPQKWIMLPKNEWCSPKRSDPPVAGWYCPKTYYAPPKWGKLPKIEVFPPKSATSPRWTRFPQNKGPSSKIKWFFWSGAPKMIDLKTVMLPKMFPPNEQFSPKMSKQSPKWVMLPQNDALPN